MVAINNNQSIKNLMNKYKTLHKWMIIPMIFMQLGIFRDYWGDFYDNAWSVHIHYWTGTIWYIYLIIQPYFATHGKMPSHRTNGIIGMFIAGGVCLTALSMMHRDIVTTQNALAKPLEFGPFQPWFFFGVAAMLGAETVARAGVLGRAAVLLGGVTVGLTASGSVICTSGTCTPAGG